jgi:L,D-transpeptidase-like protein/putative peptidoglycan binding protein
MRHRSFILVALLVTALIGGAAGVYAYDSSKADTIAEGVTVGGVDVGGLSAAEARRVLDRKVARQLERPLEVAHRKRRFRLPVEDSGVRADVDAMVDDALRESRDGTIFGRVARDLTGSEEDARIKARVTYSDQALSRLVRRVERGVNRKARDAHLAFPSVSLVRERKGVSIRQGDLRRRLERALVEPLEPRVVKAPTTVLKPKVTRAQLAHRYPILLVIERGSFRLKLYRRLRLKRAYTVAVGQVGFDTPAGLYHIQNKGVNVPWHVPNKPWAGSLAGRIIPGGAADNPIKARWLGIFDGAGIHGTDQTYSLGRAASHGCIRMAIPDVIGLYDQVPVGAPVYIA